MYLDNQNNINFRANFHTKRFIHVQMNSRVFKVLAYGKGIAVLKLIDSSLVLTVILQFDQVFLATDNDEAPMLCFLLQGQKSLLQVRLQSIEANNVIISDGSIPAVSAAPVTVTCPG